MALSKKTFSTILMGGLPVRTRQTASVDAAKNSAQEINFYAVRNLQVTAGEDNRAIMARSAGCLRGFAACFEGSTERGIIYGHGLYAPKDSLNSKFANEAYELGKNV